MTLQEIINSDRKHYKKAIETAPRAPKSKKISAGWYVSIGGDGELYHITKTEDGYYTGNWIIDTDDQPTTSAMTKKQALNQIS